MDIIPCLVCGESITPPVKTEDVSDFPRDEGDQVDIFPPTGLAVDNVAGGLGGQSSSVGWTEEEKSLYYWFAKWFKLIDVLTSQSKKRERKRVLLDRGWESESGIDKFPFCEQCKGQLSSLWELQCMVEEIQRQIERGLNVVKEKAEENEEKFRKSGIYSKDERYRRVRKRMVASFRVGDEKAKPTKINGGGPEKEPVERRKSSRTRPGTESFEMEETPVDFTLHALDVSISNVEENLISSTIDVKPDIVELDVEVPLKSKIEGIKKKNKKKVNRQEVPRKRTTSQSRFKDDEEESDNEIECNSFNGDDRDSDYDPDAPEPPKRGRKPKRKPAQIESDSDDYDEEETRKKGRYTIDPAKGTLTYNELTFQSISDSVYKCPLCDALVTHDSVKSSQVRRHLLTVHWNKNLCREKGCTYRAPNKSQLKRHVLKVHKGVQCPRKFAMVNCEICGKPLKKIMKFLKRHKWTHFSEAERQSKIESGSSDVPYMEKSLICDICGKSCVGQSKLEVHKLRKHSTQEDVARRQVPCPVCGKLFFDFALQGHVKRAHEETKKPIKTLKCVHENCSFMADLPSKMRQHNEAVHKKIRPFKCSHCPREFNKNFTLKQHMLSHLGVRPFQCSDCPMSFVSRHTLARHERLYHTEGVPPPRRKAYIRGPTLLKADVTKCQLQNEGKYLPPSALASWAQGREPTSHILTEDGTYTDPTTMHNQEPKAADSGVKVNINKKQQYN